MVAINYSHYSFLTDTCFLGEWWVAQSFHWLIELLGVCFGRPFWGQDRHFTPKGFHAHTASPEERPRRRRETGLVRRLPPLWSQPQILPTFSSSLFLQTPPRPPVTLTGRCLLILTESFLFQADKRGWRWSQYFEVESSRKVAPTPAWLLLPPLLAWPKIKSRSWFFSNSPGSRN